MKQEYDFLNEEDSKVINNIIQSYFTEARINKIIHSFDSLTLSKVENFDFNKFITGNWKIIVSNSSIIYKDFLAERSQRVSSQVRQPGRVAG